MIADEIVEQVRAAADAVEIIGEFVKLKRSGSTWRGPCPFHHGEKPNFAVSPAHGTFHCFVCHESGDVFTFVRKKLGLDWPSAVKYVGEKCGIEVIDSPRSAPEIDPNSPNHEVLAAAAEWFMKQLADETVGREARDYLEKRGLDTDSCRKFGIGFAPRDSRMLRSFLHSIGHADERLFEAGLLVQRDGEAEPRLRFRGRIIFPILDERGRNVGFGGRAMGDEQPKYLNSPESAVFQKRRTLYGMQTARFAMRRSGRAIVVEGYLDVIRLMLAGVEEVVAPLGTAMTEEQANLLVRHAREVFLVYDSDAAGQKATFRSGLELLRQSAAVRVVTLPDDEDPDSYVRKFGKAALETRLSQAIDLFDRQIQLLERRGWFSDLRRRRQALDKLLPTIRAASDTIVRDLYLARLSQVTGLEKTALAAEAEAMHGSYSFERRRGSTLSEVSAPAGLSGGHSGESGETGDAGLQNETDNGAVRKWNRKGGRSQQGGEWKSSTATPRVAENDPVERALVRAMLGNRELAERVAERHPPGSFRSPVYAELFRTLLETPIDEDLEAVSGRLSDRAVAMLNELGEAPFGADAADVSLIIGKLDARVIQARIETILEEMRRTSSSSEKDALLRERHALERELRQLLPIRSPRTKPRR